MTGDWVMETFCQEGAVSKFSFLRISSLMFCFVICLNSALSCAHLGASFQIYFPLVLNESVPMCYMPSTFSGENWMKKLLIWGKFKPKTIENCHNWSRKWPDYSFWPNWSPGAVAAWRLLRCCLLRTEPGLKSEKIVFLFLFGFSFRLTMIRGASSLILCHCWTDLKLKTLWTLFRINTHFYQLYPPR